MTQISTIGLDIAKNSSAVHGFDAKCQCGCQSRWSADGDADRAGSPARLPQCPGGSPYRIGGLLGSSRIALCRAGWSGNPGGPHYRHPLRPAGADHRAGDGKRLRQPHRTSPSYPAGNAADRRVRQWCRLRPAEGIAGLKPSHPAEWQIHRSRAPTGCRFGRLCRARRRRRLSLVGSRQSGGTLDPARRRRGARHRRQRPPGQRHPRRRSRYDQRCRPADCSPPALYPADAHHPVRLSRPGDRHPRSRARTLWRLIHGEAEARRHRRRQAGQAQC